MPIAFKLALLAYRKSTQGKMWHLQARHIMPNCDHYTGACDTMCWWRQNNYNAAKLVCFFSLLWALPTPLDGQLGPTRPIYRDYQQESIYSMHPIRMSRTDEVTLDYSRHQLPMNYGSVSHNIHHRLPSSSSLSSPSSYKLANPSYLAATNPMILRHPGSCSYDRSHSACSFSLVCYLANGVPVENCEGSNSVTCCYLNSKTNPSSGTAYKTESYVSNSSPQYNHQYNTPISELSGVSTNSETSSASMTSVSLHSPVNYHTASSSLSNYYSPNSQLRSYQYNSPLMTSTGSQNNVDTKSNYLDYKSKPDFELSQSQQTYTNLSPKEMDYLQNAIRRTRTENNKSFFREIAHRKLYARNYEVEDICGKPLAKPRSRIIGGQDAYFGEFPWQVHIKITKHQCGGALVNSRFIVTAAHCIYQAPLQQLNVIIGAHDIEDPRYQDLPPQYFGVSQVILHPNFRFSASHPDRYDIALIKLDKPVRFSDNVLPVCLPEENVSFEGLKGVVTGWGKTDAALSNRYGTRLLQKVDVPIIDNDKCENWHRTRGIDLRIFTEMMCAGYEDGQKDACVGDSGGPLVINVHGRWILAGITSAGFGCAQSKQPGIYHRVSHTVEWIKATARVENDT